MYFAAISAPAYPVSLPSKLSEARKATSFSTFLIVRVFLESGLQALKSDTIKMVKMKRFTIRIENGLRCIDFVSYFRTKTKQEVTNEKVYSHFNRIRKYD